jgi:hypothetical protein
MIAPLSSARSNVPRLEAPLSALLHSSSAAASMPLASTQTRVRLESISQLISNHYVTMKISQQALCVSRARRSRAYAFLHWSIEEVENSLGHRPRMLTLSCQCFKFQTASYPTVTVLSPSNNIPYYLRVYGTSFPRLPTVSLFQVTTALPTGQRYCTKDTRAYHSPNSYWGKIAWLKPTAQLSSTPSFEVPSRRHARWTVGKKVTTQAHPT